MLVHNAKDPDHTKMMNLQRTTLSKKHYSIHPSRMERIAAAIGRKPGYALDRWPVCWSLTQRDWQPFKLTFISPINLTLLTEQAGVPRENPRRPIQATVPTAVPPRCPYMFQQNVLGSYPVVLQLPTSWSHEAFSGMRPKTELKVSKYILNVALTSSQIQRLASIHILCTPFAFVSHHDQHKLAVRNLTINNICILGRISFKSALNTEWRIRISTGDELTWMLICDLAWEKPRTETKLSTKIAKQWHNEELNFPIFTVFAVFQYFIFFWLQPTIDHLPPSHFFTVLTILTTSSSVQPGNCISSHTTYIHHHCHLPVFLSSMVNIPCILN